MAQLEQVDEVRHARAPVVLLDDVPVFADQDLGHLLDDLDEGLDLAAVARDADAGDDGIIEHDRGVDAVLGAAVLVLAVNDDLLFRLDGEKRALMGRSDTRAVGAGDNGARRVEQVDFVIDDIFEVVDDSLCDLGIEVHGHLRQTVTTRTG